MSKHRVLILALILAVAGIGMFLYKVEILGFPLQPDEQAPVWTVEARLSFEAGPGPVKLRGCVLPRFDSPQRAQRPQTSVRPGRAGTRAG